MPNKLLYCLPWLLLAGCADTTEKYRDITHLERPPTLAIEASAIAQAADTEAAAKPKTESRAETAPTNSELDNLILLAGSENHPTLQLKTRFDRAWDLVDRALQLAEIEVADKNRDAGVFRVRYVEGGQGKGRRFINSVTSFFSDTFEDIEYTLTLDKDRRITEIRVAKIAPPKEIAGNGEEAFNNDDSASLIKLLQKTIKSDLEK